MALLFKLLCVCALAATLYAAPYDETLPSSTSRSTGAFGSPPSAFATGFNGSENQTSTTTSSTEVPARVYRDVPIPTNDRHSSPQRPAGEQSPTQSSERKVRDTNQQSGSTGQSTPRTSTLEQKVPTGRVSIPQTSAQLDRKVRDSPDAHAPQRHQNTPIQPQTRPAPHSIVHPLPVGERKSRDAKEPAKKQPLPLPKPEH